MALGMDLAAWRVLLSHRLEAVARADSMRAIREGLLWVLPCLMVSAVFLVLSVLARVLGLPPAVGDMLAGLHGEISRILPLLIAASIGYMLAIRHQLPRLPVAFLCFVYVALASYQLSGQPRAAATLVLQLSASALILSGWYRWLGALALAGFTALAALLADRFWAAPPAERQRSANAFFEHWGLVGGMLLVAWHDLGGRHV